MAVLDIGCGPGTITVDLARVVAPGPVAGIDLHRRLSLILRQNEHGEELGVVRIDNDPVAGLPAAQATAHTGDGAFKLCAGIRTCEAWPGCCSLRC